MPINLPPDATAHLLQQSLAYVVLPIWLAAGFADWLCHKAQRIEATAGLTESLLHWAMIAELGAAICAAVLLQPTAAVLALLVALCVAHEATMWRDLLYAARRRPIAVVEQWVHGIQTVLPWAGLGALLLVHRDQALAIVGAGAEAADWGWRLKDPLPPAGGLVAAAAAAALLVALPFAEECRRCALQRRSSSARPVSASPTPKLR